jgi:hypothetical protein
MIKTPFVAMWGILLTGIMLTLFAVGIALFQPWFGLTLALENDHIVIDTISISHVKVQKERLSNRLAVQMDEIK